MKPTITVLSRENKILKKLRIAKTLLREYMAKGGAIKDYHPKKKNLD